MKKIKMLGLALAAAFAFAGCRNQVSMNEGFENSSSTPYASEAELTSLSQNGFVNYKVARYYANIAMQQFSETNGWKGTKVSDYPLVIYDLNSENPKFYEFRILKDGEEIGAVACVANSSDGEAVQYVMPFATDFSESNARSVSGKNGRLVAANYPMNIGFAASGSSRVLDASTDDLLAVENGEEVSVLDFIENADAETLEALEITGEAKGELIAEHEAEQARLAEYWDFIEKNEAIILATTDEEIQAVYDELYSESGRAVIHSQSTDEYIIPEYKEKLTWSNPGGWCGPSCMFLVARGLGEKSGYKDFPKYGDYNSMLAMYKDFEDTIGTGPKLFSQLSNGLQALTDYKLCKYPLGDSYNVKKDYIRNNSLPCVSLRTSAFGKSWAWHYRVIIGTRTVTNNTKVTVFGRTLMNFNTYEKYYIMHDNGADSGDGKKSFYEKAGRLCQIRSAYVAKK